MKVKETPKLKSTTVEVQTSIWNEFRAVAALRGLKVIQALPLALKLWTSANK
jgi:hypothetical protein